MATSSILAEIYVRKKVHKAQMMMMKEREDADLNHHGGGGGGRFNGSTDQCLHHHHERGKISTSCGGYGGCIPMQLFKKIHPSS